MNQPEPSIDAAGSQRPTIQYGLPAIVWWTTTLAICLAYLRLHSRESVLLGVAAISVAAVAGLSVGWIAKRLLDTCNWAIFGVIFPYTSILTSSFADETPYVISWLAVGALAGITAAIVTGTWLRRTVIVAAVTWIPMAIVGLSGSYPLALWLEVFCASAAGAGFAMLVELILTLESRYGLKRYVSTCGIVLLSIVISSAGPRLIEGLVAASHLSWPSPGVFREGEAPAEPPIPACGTAGASLLRSERYDRFHLSSAEATFRQVRKVVSFMIQRSFYHASVAWLLLAGLGLAAETPDTDYDESNLQPPGSLIAVARAGVGLIELAVDTADQFLRRSSSLAAAGTESLLHPLIDPAVIGHAASPKTKLGYVDFATILNEARHSQIESSENLAVDLLRVYGPKEAIYADWRREAICREIGLLEPDREGSFTQSFDFRWNILEKISSAEERQAANRKLDHQFLSADEGEAWTGDHHSQVVQWLNDNSEALAEIERALRKMRFFEPLVFRDDRLRLTTAPSELFTPARHFQEAFFACGSIIQLATTAWMTRSAT